VSAPSNPSSADVAGPRGARYIAVVGPSDADSELYELALQTGQLIARRGAVVVCGALGGVMEAAALGAAQAGGASLGILPGDDRSAANPHLTMVVASGLGELRNGLLVRASDAVVAVGCSWGTLSELALAVRIGRPVVALGCWSLSDRAGNRVAGVREAETPVAAVAAVFELLEGGSH
jgi:uncharacterized protein (TIGR00725 family)